MTVTSLYLSFSIHDKILTANFLNPYTKKLLPDCIYDKPCDLVILPDSLQTHQLDACQTVVFSHETLPATEISKLRPSAYNCVYRRMRTAHQVIFKLFPF